MLYVNRKVAILLLIFCAACIPSEKKRNASNPTSQILILPPQELYGDLFYEVQSRTDLFPDSKTFVDAIPKRNVKNILADFEKMENNKSSEEMMDFLRQNFVIPGYRESGEIPSASSPTEHINNLWSYLERPSDVYETGTKIPLPNSYIVPGGRFREVYYWDSYFTMLGLKVDGRNELIDHILANFSLLIDSVGFVPNGNRTYYGTRSQPPFYSLMVQLSLVDNSGKSLVDYHDFLFKEYNFWMNGNSSLNESKTSYRRVVWLGNGNVLNRYWDDSNTPRPESYREDLETVETVLKKYPDRSKEESYRHLRAAAESGWDFSSRWFNIGEDGAFDLSTIHTTDIIPVDLNSLLYNLEWVLSESFKLKGMEAESELFIDKAMKRKKLIDRYCWSKKEGFYMDYDFIKRKHTSVKSLAGLYPLFFEIASDEKADQVSEVVKELFLMKGGVVTTLNNSGEQWDFPNGWAPLQWMTIQGLRNYDKMSLADEIKRRWLELNTHVFENTHKMMEKYNVVDMNLKGGGGEYPNQDGFGWTNGVFQRLVKEH